MATQPRATLNQSARAVRTVGFAETIFRRLSNPFRLIDLFSNFQSYQPPPPPPPQVSETPTEISEAIRMLDER
jgi:hypothetical protein